MRYNIKLQRITVRGSRMLISFTGTADVKSEVAHPKVIMHFICGEEDRRMPMVIRESIIQDGVCFFSGEYVYELPYIFHNPRDPYAPVKMYINVLFEDYYEEKANVDLTPEIFECERNFYDVDICGNYLVIKSNQKKTSQDVKQASTGVKIYTWVWFAVGCILIPLFLVDAILAEKKIVPYKSLRCAKGRTPLRRIIGHVNDSLMSFSRHKISALGMKVQVLRMIYFFEKRRRIEPNTVGLMSVRRAELSGNMAFVYDKLKNNPDVKIKMFLCPKEIQQMNIKELVQIARLCATCKVIALDEYTSYMYRIKLKPETKIIQLWHACGAFKTFGYTRLGKPGGTAQNSPNHRNYDYVTVSSKSVQIWYAEGFGIPTSHVVPTGVPRTDIFFDPAYKERTLKTLYEKYPMLKGRRVILYAPTFRGDTRDKAFYPMEKFDVGHFMSNIPEDYVMIIKHHPFVTEKHPVPDKYHDRVLDLSAEFELNDLLFLTDVVITDYSSLVFEASLLNIPMLFYTFDLKEYILSRDFYFNFETFVPGRFFYKQEEMEQAIREENYEQEKVAAFAKKFFDDRDGRASERVADLICRALNE